MTSMWIEFFRSAKGSLVGATAAAGLFVTRRSWSSMVLLPPEAEQRADAATRVGGGRLDGMRSVVREEPGEVVERRRRIGLGARERDGHALVHRAGNLSVGRDVHVRLAPEDRDHVVLADADTRVGAVEHELDLLRVVVHQ